MTLKLDAVVVGAGQAGLGISYFLKQNGHSHTVFERGQIGETWRSQRWDSFALNTPNWSNGLPGAPYDGDEPDGFWRRDDLVRYFQQYAERFDLPIQTGMTVTSVDRDGDSFLVRAENSQGKITEVTARQVVVASGIMHTPKIPPLSQSVPDDILQLHTATYRNPNSLLPGAVVIVGGGQSGCQIAEDLVGTGRALYLCSSKAGRIPRRYRGREILEWWADMGFWDVATKDLEDPTMAHATQPQISGVGRYGHSVSYQHLARQGVHIVGRLVDVVDGNLFFDDTARENVLFGDEASERFKKAIDSYLEREGIALPPKEPDPADEADPDASCVTAIDRLNLSEAGVQTIIWATGFTATFDWLHAPVMDPNGMPVHKEGIAPIEGIYFIGFPWLSKRKSGTIYGIEDDARAIVNRISARLG
jgi:putative flavoprotein involved in K+ transport